MPLVNDQSVRAAETVDYVKAFDGPSWRFANSGTSQLIFDDGHSRLVELAGHGWSKICTDTRANPIYSHGLIKRRHCGAVNLLYRRSPLNRVNTFPDRIPTTFENGPALPLPSLRPCFTQRPTSHLRNLAGDAHCPSKNPRSRKLSSKQYLVKNWSSKPAPSTASVDDALVQEITIQRSAGKRCTDTAKKARRRVEGTSTYQAV